MDAPPFALSTKAYRTGEQPISRLMYEAVMHPELINLGAGLVDYDSLPTDALRACFDTLLEAPDSGRAALQYGTTRGLAELRDVWLNHVTALDGLTPNDLALSSEHVVLTTGSQQGLYLLTEALVDPGDVVITSAPSYFVYTHALASFGADVRTVPMDEDGMCIDALEVLMEDLAAIGKLDRVKIIYVVSSFQNPTGLSLSAPRRRQLVELARTYSRHHRIVVVEDAAYRELRYDGPDVPSVKSFDPENRFVVLATTFSKPFSPGLKTGALILPEELVLPVLWQKGNHDFGSQNLAQHALLAVIKSGAYASQVARLRAVYASKRDVMLEAMETHLPKLDGLSWLRPKGGLYVWLKLPPGRDASAMGELFRRCVEKGVLYVPGAYCYTGDIDKVPVHELRLSFGAAAPDALVEGVRRLGQALREEAAAAPADVGVRHNR